MVKQKEKSSPAYQWVTTTRELRTMLDRLKNKNAVGVDMEMDSMFHYREKICLIQMATERETFLLDPLKIPDMKPLKPLFENKRIKKVFHGGDYDVRSLFRDFNINVSNLFDTQLASRFLGIQQTGLEAVLNSRFNVVLDKRYQKKDWSQRPLPEHMLAYAARDACFLVPLSRELEKELRGKKRLAWVKEECEWLSRVRPAANHGQPLFLNFKGAGRLKPGDLAVLEALLQYRKSVAKAKDRPLFKTIGNATLLTLAGKKPTSKKQLQATSALSAKQAGQYGSEIVKVIKTALKLPADQHPVYPRKRLPSLKPAVSNRIREIKLWRDAKAEQLGIDPSLVLTKMLICDIAKKHPRSVRQMQSVEGIRRWRVREFGRAIVTLLKDM
ncbi:MAG: HRDC domain-containing protein [Deltaproteobacteria bacterium]|nr:HRDC domain-containing protein [Deltaproteobacteria bacterium]